MVPKKDNQLRYCCDFRYINSFTKPQAYPQPRIDDTLDALADAEVFSLMDCASGYWGVPIAEDHKQFTSFATWTHGQLEWNVMPFGLKNASAYFQRAMQNILHGLVRTENAPGLSLTDVLGAAGDTTLAAGCTRTRRRPPRS